MIEIPSFLCISIMPRSLSQDQDLAVCGAVHTNKNQSLPWRIYKLNKMGLREVERFIIPILKMGEAVAKVSGKSWRECGMQLGL